MELFQKKHWLLMVLAAINYTIFILIIYNELSDRSISNWLIVLIGFVLTNFWASIGISQGYYNICKKPLPTQMSPLEYKCSEGKASPKEKLILIGFDFLLGFLTPSRIFLAIINMLIAGGIAKFLFTVLH